MNRPNFNSPELNLQTCKRILVIQTAFLGDAVLATALLEKLHRLAPNAQIDFMVRKGHEALTQHHPYIHKTIIWDKSSNKFKYVISLLKQIRGSKYDLVINLQRFASTGFLTAFSKAKFTIGFSQNPW
ncbi:MAG: glycosyltransferase family 9 protein, partial [Proteobacteria bacterium]|nr:glycosyltransferase family 9 protein [Pseudomonadota bacterium]